MILTLFSRKEGIRGFLKKVIKQVHKFTEATKTQ